MKRNPRSYWSISAYRVGLALLLLMAGLPIAGAQSSFIGPLSLGPSFSTVPAIGDVNPYGITVVPVTTGNLVQGDILISNFNNSANLQGTGTTIMEISPGGAVQTFAQINASSLPGSCPGRSWPDNSISGFAGRLGDRRQSANDRRYRRHRSIWLSAGTKQYWSSGRNILGRSDQWPVGRHASRRRHDRGAFLHQRAERDSSRQRPGGPDGHGCPHVAFGFDDFHAASRAHYRRWFRISSAY